MAYSKVPKAMGETDNRTGLTKYKTNGSGLDTVRFYFEDGSRYFSAENPDFESLRTVAGFAYLEANAVVLSQTEKAVIGYIGTMKEDLFLVFVNDEAIVFLFIEPFNRAFLHTYLSISMMIRMRWIVSAF